MVADICNHSTQEVVTRLPQTLDYPGLQNETQSQNSVQSLRLVVLVSGFLTT